MNKYVIYTVITGGYDDVLQPLVIDDRFDYILFSNDFKEKQIGIWKVHNIPQPNDISTGDNKRLSRYPKCHPETLLSEYESSLYLDANIQITDSWIYEKCIDYANRKVEFASILLSNLAHPFAPGPRDDIYEHMYDMCSILIEHDYDVIKQCHKLYKLGFPMHYGLNENNMIFRLHTEKMKQCDEEWWWWITNYSFRDQFSYMYCLRKYQIGIEYFFPYGTNVRNTPHFIYYRRHLSENNGRTLQPHFFERVRLRCKNLNPNNYNRYCKHWFILMKMPNPNLALNVWGVLIGIINTPMLVRSFLKNRLQKIFK